MFLLRGHKQKKKKTNKQQLFFPNLSPVTQSDTFHLTCLQIKRCLFTSFSSSLVHHFITELRCRRGTRTRTRSAESRSLQNILSCAPRRSLLEFRLLLWINSLTPGTEPVAAVPRRLPLARLTSRPELLKLISPLFSR